MGQSVSSLMFTGENWNFERVLEHSRLSEEQLRESREHLIDVREREEIRRDGSIPNAVNIPMNELPVALTSREKYSPETERLIFTCLSGMRAANAAKMAEKAGFDVAFYPGSYSDWLRRQQK
jgi:rhodanese-related sulfurtransferase